MEIAYESSGFLGFFFLFCVVFGSISSTRFFLSIRWSSYTWISCIWWLLPEQIEEITFEIEITQNVLFEKRLSADFFFFFKKMITTPTRLGFVGWFSNLIGFFVVGVVESLLCQAAKKCTHIEISQRRRQKRSIYQRKKTNKQLNNNKIDDDKSQIQKNRQKE